MLGLFKRNKDKLQYEEIIKGLNLDSTQKLVLTVTWLDYLFLLDRRAWVGHRGHTIIQLAVVTLSLIIPIIEGSIYKDRCLYNISLISLISFMIAIMTAITNQLRFETKWSHSRKNAEIVRNEGEDYFALAGNYQSCANHSDALRAFITTITIFKRQEVSTYLETAKNKEDGKGRPKSGGTTK